jgi:hypothetical protein
VRRFTLPQKLLETIIIEQYFPLRKHLRYQKVLDIDEIREAQF